jgi:endoglucanase/chitinase
MARLGFNCIRVDFNDKNVQDPATLTQFDQLVAACKDHGLKVIFDHHNNEATPANWGNAAQQTNGLWYDIGPGTDGTDGVSDKGTISNDQFLEDWVSLAKRYSGNSTVIGFDLDNEPHVGYGTPYNGLNWGDGGPGDIRTMFTNVGNAIEAVDPGVLIICEGPMDVTDKSSVIWWSMDLSHVATKPVVLKIPNKVVYSVHEYPAEVSGIRHDHGQEYIDEMNADWGYLETKNIAPVWVGELGAPTSASDADGNGWEATILPYLSGEDSAVGGPKFTGADQPIGTDLWRWGSAPNVGDGCLSTAGAIRPEIADYVSQLMFYHEYRPALKAAAVSSAFTPGAWQQMTVNCKTNWDWLFAQRAARVSDAEMRSLKSMLADNNGLNELTMGSRQ